MVEERILPDSYPDLEEEMGEEIRSFDVLFEDALKYYDSLLGQDARSSPGVEEHFLERFKLLLKNNKYLIPRDLRASLIKLTYGYYMRVHLNEKKSGQEIE